jgi:hypothetical protein
MSGTVQGYSSGVNYSGVFNLRRGGTTPTGVPPAPTGVTATAGDGNVSISWSAVSGATSYNLYHSTTSGVTKTTGTKITSVTSPYTHTGLTNGITYYYLVTAVNSSGESVESAQVSAAPTAGGGMLQLIGLYPQLYNHYGTNIFVLGNYAYFCEEHVSWTDTYVRILNVATPSAPSLAGSYFVGGVIRAINVADGYMYLGLDNILHEVQTVNIANPAAPSLTAKDTDVSPLDLAVSGSYLYVVGNRALDPPDYIGYDFTSYSLSNKAVPLIVGRYSHPETASDYYREVAVQGNYAYIAANDNGLVVLDISNPAAPSYVGRYSSSVFKGYLKVSVSGDYACVMNMESDIEILDISNPSSISEVGKYTPRALANDFVLSGQYLYVAEGTNGLKIIDISNPASPVVAGYYKPTGPDPISNAVFVSGQYVYVADGQYGLMIIWFTP